jgi:hypothetical protein
VIDRPAPEPTVTEAPGSEPAADERLDDARPQAASRRVAREGRYIGPLRITPAVIVVALAFVGSLLFLGYVVIAIDDQQIPLLASGFVVLGASFAATAVGSLLGMWRAASRAKGRRALLLAIVGGLAGLAAIGCFTVTALSALVWSS